MVVDQVDLCSIHTALYVEEPKVNIVGLPSELFPAMSLQESKPILYSQATVSSIAMKGPTFSLLQHPLALRHSWNPINQPSSKLGSHD